jgi:hypothetical protein
VEVSAGLTVPITVDVALALNSCVPTESVWVAIACGVPEDARAVLVPKLATSLIVISGVRGVSNKLFVPIGVLVTAGAVEYGVLQAERTTAMSINMDATVAPRFILAICISSGSNKGFDDGSTSH